MYLLLSFLEHWCTSKNFEAKVRKMKKNVPRKEAHPYGDLDDILIKNFFLFRVYCVRVADTSTL